MQGIVEGIFIAPAATVPLLEVHEVRAVYEKGLEGDRYASGVGTFSRYPGTGREITLIEREVLDDVRDRLGLDLSAGRSRRNIVTSGIRLRELMGKTFRIGDVVLRGDRPADPCGHLERLTAAGAMQALAGRGGLRASVVREGTIRTGDSIEEVANPRPT